ncbi:MAG: helix-turn-helix domain-containing protein [Candidatus Methanomethylophilaceae archaeon]|jgi:hypothetical protein
MHSLRIRIDRSKNKEESPCHGLLPVDIDDDGVKVQIITCSMLDQGTGYSMVRILDSDGTHLEEGTYEGEYGSCVINKFSPKHYVAMVINKRCKLSSLINEAGCFLTSAVPITDTEIEWKLIGPNNTALHNLVDNMRDAGFAVELISSESVDMDFALTDKQEQYFDVAMNLGYYDIPKRAGLDELCRVLGCSKSTLNIVLRTAEKKIFDMYMAGGMAMRVKR